MRSVRASSGNRPQYSFNGTTGVGFTTTYRRRSKTTTGSVSACRCSCSRRTRSTTTSRTCSSKRRASCASPRTLGPRSARRRRQARELAGNRLLRLLAEAAPVRQDRRAPSAEVLHAAVRRLPSPRLGVATRCRPGATSAPGNFEEIVEAAVLFNRQPS